MAAGTVGRLRFDAVRGREILLVLALLFGYGFFQQVPVWNEYSRYDLVRAIVEDGTTRIDRFHGNTGDEALFEGHYYSDKPPGTGLLGVPVYAGLRLIDGLAGAGEPEPQSAVQALAFVESGLPTVLLVLLLLRFLRPAVGETWALVVSIGYGLGSMAFPFATMFFGHALSTFFLFAAFYQLWRWRSDPRDWRPALAGFLVGCGVVTEYPILLGALALGLYAASLGRRPIVGFVLGGLPLVLVLGLYDWISFGDPFRIGYQFSTNFADQNRQGIISVVWPSLGTAVDLLVGPRGLLHLAPWFVFVPLGLVALRRRAIRREILVATAICVAFVVFNSGALNPFGGWTPGPRYLMPALPFAAILAAYARPVWRPLMTAGIALAVLVFAAATVTMPNAPELFRAPLSELWVPRLSSGEIAQTLAWLQWGLPGAVPLLVLFLGLAGAGGALVATFRSRVPADRIVIAAAPAMVVLIALFSFPFLPPRPVASPRDAASGALTIKAAGATWVRTGDVRGLRIWAQVENPGGELTDTRINFTAVGPTGESVWSPSYGNVTWPAGARRSTSLEWDTREVQPGAYRLSVSVESQQSGAVLVTREAGQATIGQPPYPFLPPDDLLSMLLIAAMVFVAGTVLWRASAEVQMGGGPDRRPGARPGDPGSDLLHASPEARAGDPTWLDRMKSAVGEMVGGHPLLLLMTAGLGLRLLLAWVVFPTGGHASDLRFFESWMQTLAHDGLIGPNPDIGFGLFAPGLLWVLWPAGLLAEGFAALMGLPPADVYPAVVKLPAIAADMLIALLLVRAVTAWEGRRAGLVAAGLYLFVPVTWYESAVWGQVDAIGALLVLAAVVLLIEGWSEGAAVAAAAAAVTKPQFAIALVVVGAVLVRRHLLQPGTGPVPSLVGRLAGLDGLLGGWLTRRQGLERLVSSIGAGVVAGIAIILPFRYAELANASGPPLVADFAGFLSFVGRQASLAPMLTVNAFNPWALVGPEPLIGSVGHWTRDSLIVLGGLDGFTIGVILFVALVIVVGLRLLLREDRASILMAATVLAVALFVLPTRVHERYIFAALAVAVPLAATSRGWRVWYLALATAFVANLHAVLTLPDGQYGSADIVALPFGDILRSSWAVGLVVVTMAALFGTSLSRLVPGTLERTRAAYRAFDERWPVRDVVPDAGTVLLIVLAVALLLRAAWLSLPQGAFIFDEAYYVNAAKLIAGIHPLAGGHYADQPLFLDPNTEHPPLGKVLMAGSILLFGDNGLGWRIPSLVAGMVALGALYGVVRAAGGRPWLGVLAVTLYSLDVLSFIHGRIGTLDMMSVAFLLVGAWLGLRGQWALAGAALALGTLIKVPGAYGLLAALLWQGFGLWRSYRQRRLTWNDLAPTGALVGAYAFVGLAGLWLLDLRFTTYSNPLDHISHMFSYGFALQGAFNPSGGITSAPWQWLVNEGQFDYLKTSVNTLANGEVIGSRAIIQFRALLNPALIGAMPLAVLFAVWLAWKRGEALVTWGLLWIAANYLPYWELALLSNRITYFYYVLPAVPGLVVLVAAFLVHGRLPRAVVWGFVGVTILAFIAYFPFRQLP